MVVTAPTNSHGRGIVFKEGFAFIRAIPYIHSPN